MTPTSRVTSGTSTRSEKLVRPAGFLPFGSGGGGGTSGFSAFLGMAIAPLSPPGPPESGPDWSGCCCCCWGVVAGGVLVEAWPPAERTQVAAASISARDATDRFWQFHFISFLVCYKIQVWR